MEFIEGPAFSHHLARYWFDGQNQIWLMTVYDKNEAVDLTPGQRKALKAAIDAEKKSRTRR